MAKCVNERPDPKHPVKIKPLSVFYRWFCIYIVLSVVVLLIFINVTNVINLYELNSHGEKAQGIVSEKLCERHQQFNYEFYVGNAKFNGIGVFDFGRPCDALKLGEQVVVFYLPSNPSVNINSQPSDNLENELISMFFAAFLFPAVILLAFFVHRKRNTINGVRLD